MHTIARQRGQRAKCEQGDSFDHGYSETTEAQISGQDEFRSGSGAASADARIIAGLPQITADFAAKRKSAGSGHIQTFPEMIR
jgi:hypothetical protein